MFLSKRIPARTKTLKFDWCHRDFRLMDDDWRKIRANMTPLDKCYWCGYAFVNGDMIALAHLTGKGNKVLCQTCADLLLNSEVKNEDENEKFNL